MRFIFMVRVLAGLEIVRRCIFEKSEQ